MNEIYFSGILISIILGLIVLTFSNDDDCNISIPQCALIAAPIFSLFSWLSVLVIVLIIVLVEFRQRILKK